QNLTPDSAAVAAGFAAGDEGAGRGAVHAPDDLFFAEWAAVGLDRDVVATVGQLVHDVAGDALLQHHAQALGDLPARGVQRRLRVHFEVDGIHDDLDVALGLHVPVYHAEGPDRLAVAREERWNDRVVWALARRERVRVARIEAEAEATVLERDP